MQTKLGLSAAACLLVFGLFAAETPSTYRPLYHFTPEKNWINDPNGLVYDGSEYHMFYQYNPFGDLWGHMSWGHAVSTNLTTWTDLPVAIPEENGIMIFSGSAVVDSKNSSGFGRDGKTPMVAMYTGNSPNLQTQNIAYSLDLGRTWTRYSGNPVIDLHEAEFRDPMVFWHQPTQRWIMVVSLAKAHKVRFYASPDLKAWTQLSEFGPAGAYKVPNWECPNLFEVPLENSPGQHRWVLMLGVGDGGPAGGSATQYFVGDFDGTKFTNANPPSTTLWMDLGADFYAAQTWSHIPSSDGRRIVLAWMSNWQYAAKLPTSPWRGQMTYPRTLELAGARLVQKPVKELDSLRTAHQQLRNASFAQTKAFTAAHDWPETLEISANLKLNGATGLGFELRQGPGHGTRIGFDSMKGVLYVDRTQTGGPTIDPKFPARHEAPLTLRNGELNLRILLDRCSVEVFADGGSVAMTDLIFPFPSDKKLSMYATGAQPKTVALDVWTLAKAR